MGEQVVGETKALTPTVVEHGPAASADLVPAFVVTLDQARQRLQELQAFVKAMMVEGEDYGRIPGTPKPTLLKPGAEKLCDVYGFSKAVDVTGRIEDWEKGFFAYEVKVTLTSKRTGVVEAEGVGSCNSKERRYRNQDAWSVANTVLKMAKKRALVDAVLSATRSSGLFTQDLEDLADESEPGSEPGGPAKPVPTTCADCGKPIVAVQIGQRLFKAVAVEADTKRRFGRPLCYSCGKQAAAKVAGEKGQSFVESTPDDEPSEERAF